MIAIACSLSSIVSGQLLQQHAVARARETTRVATPPREIRSSLGSQ